jgi:hypothetical protein
MKRNALHILISSVAIVFAIGHVLLPKMQIDGTTVALLVVAMLPWLGSIFESLELPGGTKIKYREQLEQVKEDARKVGLLGTPTEKEERSAFAILAKEDPNLALASLRIEIEKRLVAIATKHGLGTERQSIGILLRRLKERKALSNEQASVLQDMIGLLNRAVHGADVGQQEAQWAIEIGPSLLAGLDSHLEQ